MAFVAGVSGGEKDSGLCTDLYFELLGYIVPPWADKGPKACGTEQEAAGERTEVGTRGARGLARKLLRWSTWQWLEVSWWLVLVGQRGGCSCIVHHSIMIFYNNRSP